MTIYPAVDILNGKCVRLIQGMYSEVTTYDDDPVEVAKRWIETARQNDVADIWLHTVDLDGARFGKPTNLGAIEKIATLGVKVQTGGGNRTADNVRDKINAGVSRVVLGTAAADDGQFLMDMARLYSDKIAVGIDAKDGMVAVNGWQRTMELSAVDFARTAESAGVRTIIYTDISRDGMLRGINLPAIREMTQTVQCDVIASGGVTTIEDVKTLASTRVQGVIIGKALYTGCIDLAEVYRTAR